MPINSSRGGGSAKGFGHNVNAGGAPAIISVLVVAGGGSGGSGQGGGGGAGGAILSSCLTPLSGSTYSVTVGGGGATQYCWGRGSAGNGSSFSGPGLSTINTTGGGGGGYAYGQRGMDGGSGGGGAWGGCTCNNPGSGIPGQGNPGAGSYGPPSGGGGGKASAGGRPGGGSGADYTSLVSTTAASTLGISGVIQGCSTIFARGGAGNVGGGPDQPSYTGYGGPGSCPGSGGAPRSSAGGKGVVVIRSSKPAKSTSGSVSSTTCGTATVYAFKCSGTITF
jgi:hypothetical protein